MKYCANCKTDKPEDQFHKRSASRDGLAAKCKDCQRLYDKARSGSPKRAETRENYRKTQRGAEATRRAKKAYADRNKGKVLEVTRRYREKNPKKARAHGMVGYAIRSGNLHPEPCEICGALEKVHAHHDDYEKPLNVRWLCPQHHRDWHKEHGEALNPQ